MDSDYGVVQMFGSSPGERSLMLRSSATGGLGGRETASPFPPRSFAAALQAGIPAMPVDGFWAPHLEQYSLRDELQQQGVRSAVIVALETGGQRIGSLHVNHHEPGFFGPEKLALAETLAAQAWAVSEQARLTTARRQAEAARAAAEAAREQLQEFIALVSQD
jgi:GAF domain-containing protein